ncbi:MAG: ribonuclease E/G [Alphaproteobacteria bacterium]|nr:ribonuclease E/G [Alphaproteobacteria bacterium]
MNLYCHRVENLREMAVHDGTTFIAFDVDDLSKQDHAESIFWGRVKRATPSFAFVDIGLERPGILNISHIKKNRHSKKESLKEGDMMMVQIKREAVKDVGEQSKGFTKKGVQLSPLITLITPYFMYNPDVKNIIPDHGFRLSSSIDVKNPNNFEGIQRLKHIFETFTKHNKGSITFRTRALHASDAHVLSALTTLHTLFENNLLVAQNNQDPHKISESASPHHHNYYPPSKPCLIQRGRSNLEKFIDNYMLDTVYTDTLGDYKDADLYAQKFSSQTRVSRMSDDVFEAFGVHESWSESVETPWMTLPSGGQLLIEHTSTLTSIDVNHGHGPSLHQINKEAAEILPLLLTRRQISGNIIVDFAGDLPQSFKRTLIAILKKSIEKANIKDISHCAWSPLGWLEMRRPKIKMSLFETLSSFS